jgi:hypothetical protein
MGCGPPRVIKIGFGLSTALYWKRRPNPLSSRPERSAVERSLCGCYLLGMFFDWSESVGQAGSSRGASK